MKGDLIETARETNRTEVIGFEINGYRAHINKASSIVLSDPNWTEIDSTFSNWPDSNIESWFRKTLVALENKLTKTMDGLGIQLTKLYQKTSDRIIEQPMVVNLQGPDPRTTWQRTFLT